MDGEIMHASVFAPWQALFIVATALGSTACSPVTVDGTIDGEEPGLVEAIFWENEGDDLDRLEVMLADFENSCDLLGEYIEAYDEALYDMIFASDDDEELEAAEDLNDAEALLPAEHWLLGISFSTTNFDAGNNADRSFDGVETDEEIDDPGEFEIDARHMLRPIDWVELVEFENGDRDNFDMDGEYYRSHRGSATTGSYDPRTELEGTASASLKVMDIFSGETDGDAGSIDIEFTATYCSAMETD